MSPAAGSRISGVVPLRDKIAVFGALLGAFMAVLDIQITNSSLKDIQGGVAASIDEGTWISTGYLVSEIVVIPLTGYLAGVFGIRRYLIANAILFTGFSMLCGLSTGLIELILFRVFQGFTGGVMIPMAFTVVNWRLPPAKQPMGLAMFGLTATLAPSIGPTIGGWLTDNFGWPYIFYVNIVPGILLVSMIWYGMDKEPMRLARLKHGDWTGIVCMAVGLGSLEVVLEEGERHDWFGNPMIRNLAIVAAVFTVLFVAIEFLRENPFINLRLLRRRTLGSSCLIGLSLGIALYGSIYILPVYLATIQGYNAQQIGEVIMWMGLPQLIIFPLVPLLMRRIDARWLLAFGLVVFAASNFMNADMTPDTASDQLRWSLVIRAIGQPFVITAISHMATAGIKRENAAGASSLFNIMRNLGGSVGIAMLQTFSTWREHFHFDVISQRVTENALIVQERLQGLAGQMLPHAGNGQEASRMALAQLQNMVRTDAYVMAYSDCFYIMGMVLLASLAAIIFMRKPEAEQAAAAE